MRMNYIFYLIIAFFVSRSYFSFLNTLITFFTLVIFLVFKLHFSYLIPESHSSYKPFFFVPFYLNHIFMPVSHYSYLNT